MTAVGVTRDVTSLRPVEEARMAGRATGMRSALDVYTADVIR